MISAFGVEHTISKSFVNGKFISAAELSAKQAAKVRGGGQWKKARGVSEADAKFRQTMISPEVKTWAQNAQGVKVDRAATGGMKLSGGGATIRLGSKREGRSFVSGVAGSPKVATKISQHEAQHALPNRSSYRLHGQILPNKQKLMREEARADWHSYGHYSNTKNPSSYASGARARAGKPGGRFKLGDADKEQLRAQGLSGKDIKNARVSNRAVAASSANMVNQNTPHYRLKPKNFDAYRKLQDDLKRRKVPQRPRTFNSKHLGE